MQEAAAAGDPSRIASLIQSGGDPDALGSERTSPLILAARSGQVGALRSLVEAGADVDRPDERNGWSPLLHALHKEQMGAVETLLALGANPDAGSRKGYTPLMMAASYGNASMVRLLLAHGADPRRTLGNGENALIMAVAGATDIDRFTLGHCQTETVRALLDHDPSLRVPDTWIARWEYRFVRLFGCDEVVELIESRTERH